MPNPSTPAERARKVWDERIGAAAVQAYNWRRAAILMGVSCIVLVGGLVVQSLKTQVIPYVVTVDKSTGEVQQAGAFTSNDYTPQEAEIKFFLTDFVKNARSIQLDPIAQQKAQDRAVAFLTKNAARKYEDVKLNEGYEDRKGKVTVSVHIISIQKVTNMSGVFSYTMLPVESDEQMLINPMGLFISGFDFSNDASQVNRRQKQQ